MIRNQIVHSEFADIAIPDQSLLDYIFADSEDRDVLINTATNETYNLDYVKHGVARWSQWLRTQGVSKGDVVSILLPNTPHHVIATLAVIGCGAIASPIHVLYKTAEVQHAVNTSKSKYIILDNADESIMTDLISTFSSTNIIFTRQRDGYPSLPPVDDSIASSKQSQPTAEFRENDICALFFSSGTTGLPKCVCFKHHQLVFAMEAFRTVKNPSCRHAVVYQTLSNLMGTLTIWANIKMGVTSLLMERFNFQQYLTLVSTYQIDSISIVPPLAVMLVKEDLVHKFSLTHLRQIIVGGAPVRQELENQLKSIIGPQLKIVQGYGMTECTGPVVWNTHGQDKLASVGRPIPNTRVKVVDLESGNVLGPRESGELRIHGPSITPGYYLNPPATAQLIDADGWLRTGDVGYYDEDGYLYITDRLKELIKYNAYQIAPAELEDVLLGHPDVLEAGVVGIPDEACGQLPCAAVVRKPGTSSSEKDIEEYVNSQVALYKKIRAGVKFMEEIPKNPTGKIVRKELLRLCSEESDGGQ